MLEYDAGFDGVAARAELVRRGEASARELLELALGRIERLDGNLNAFGAVFVDRALADADRVDERRARGDREPLLGVPVAVKDEIDIAGEVTSRGTGAITARASALARPGAFVSDGMVQRLLTAEGRIGDRLGRLLPTTTCS